MNDILFEVLKCIVVVCCMVTCRYVVPWVKAQTEIAENSLLVGLARTAVMFAEQTVPAGNGKLKKTIVREHLETLLARKKIQITDEQLDALIEAAVKQMKNDDILAQVIVSQESDNSGS